MRTANFFPLITLMFFIIANNPAFAGDQVKQAGQTTVLTLPPKDLAAQMKAIDFANAVAMKMPVSTKPAPNAQEIAQGKKAAIFNGTPGVSNGAGGSGKQNPMSIPKSISSEADDGISTQEYGTFNHPFTTSRADSSNNITSKSYPFRATGKLFFNIGESSYVCSASLIKKGIILTAAHCVAGYGETQFYSNWVYVPAKDDNFISNAPYGVYGVSEATVMTSWFEGTDGCDVVCPNDVALLKAIPLNNKYPGQRTGWLGYGWDGFGFTSFAGLNAIELTQLGYPVGLDNGGIMQRTDSLGYTDTSESNFNNTIIGSRMTGGSSGGPWIANFGIDPAPTSDTPGFDAQKNIAVGVTSWGYISPDPKVQGASPFTSSNIVLLVDTFCPSTAC